MTTEAPPSVGSRKIDCRGHAALSALFKLETEMFADCVDPATVTIEVSLQWAHWLMYEDHIRTTIGDRELRIRLVTGEFKAVVAPPGFGDNPIVRRGDGSSPYLYERLYELVMS